jgi:hypothetical protein
MPDGRHVLTYWYKDDRRDFAQLEYGYVDVVTGAHYDLGSYVAAFSPDGQVVAFPSLPPWHLALAATNGWWKIYTAVPVSYFYVSGSPIYWWSPDSKLFALYLIEGDGELVVVGLDGKVVYRASMRDLEFDDFYNVTWIRCGSEDWPRIVQKLIGVGNLSL